MVFYEGLAHEGDARIPYVCAVRRTGRLGKEAMEYAFLHMCSPTRFSMGMLNVFLNMSRYDRFALTRTASQTREYDTRVRELQCVTEQRFQRKNGVSYLETSRDILTFLCEHLFVFRAMHREVKLLAQTVLYQPLCNEVKVMRQSWQDEHDRIVREFAPDVHYLDGTIYYNARSVITALVPAAPMLPADFKIMWDKTVGFVE